MCCASNVERPVAFIAETVDARLQGQPGHHLPGARGHARQPTEPPGETLSLPTRTNMTIRSPRRTLRSTIQMQSPQVEVTIGWYARYVSRTSIRNRYVSVGPAGAASPVLPQPPGPTAHGEGPPALDGVAGDRLRLRRRRSAAGPGGRHRLVGVAHDRAAA